MSSSNVAVRAAEQAWEAAKREQRDYMDQVVRGEVADKQEAQTGLETHSKRVEQAQQLYMQLASRVLDQPSSLGAESRAAPSVPSRVAAIDTWVPATQDSPQDSPPPQASNSPPMQPYTATPAAYADAPPPYVDDPPRYDSALTSAPGGPHPLPGRGYDPPTAPARPVQTTIRPTAAAAGPMPGDSRRPSQGDYVPAALPTGGAGAGGPSRAAIAQAVGPMQRAVVEQPTKATVLVVQDEVQNPQSAAAAVKWMTWYTVFAWISCLICCWPIGIVSVVYSCKMQQSVTNNNTESAKRNAKWTLVWAIVSVVVGLIVIITASAVSASQSNSSDNCDPSYVYTSGGGLYSYGC